MTDKIQADHPEQIQRVPPPPSAWGAVARSCRFPWSLHQRHNSSAWTHGFPPRHDKGGPFPGLKNRRAAPKVAPVSLPSAGMVLSGVLAIVRLQHFLPSHGGCFSPSVLRFRLGRFPLVAERRLPSSVLGPVDNPPCRRHRPLSYRYSYARGDEPAWHGWSGRLQRYSPRMWGWGIPSAAGTQKSPAWKFHTGRALRAGAVSLSGRGEDVFAD